MSRLTAEKARSMAQAKDPGFAVDEILAGVEKAASEGKYEYITRDYEFGSGKYYGSERGWPPLGLAIIKELRALGYRADVRCHEGQFVDMWLQVNWEPPK